MMTRGTLPTIRAFSLVELLVSIAIIALLSGLLLPSLSRVREAGRAVACASNQRQMMIAWSMYAADHHDRVMPAAGDSDAHGSESDDVFWFGSTGNRSGVVDPQQGFLWPYLESSLAENSVYECPSQPWQTYTPQTATGEITTTYGYNGYYLSPPRTPGWNWQIGHRPWRRTWEVSVPSQTLAFADTLLPGNPPRNSALLDPPMLFGSQRRWRTNAFPTTAFRHLNSARGAMTDSSVTSLWAQPEQLKPDSIGSVEMEHYVPDWRDW